MIFYVYCAAILVFMLFMGYFLWFAFRILRGDTRPWPFEGRQPPIPMEDPHIKMRQSVIGLSGEDLDWFLKQAETAGFDIDRSAPALQTVPVRKETLGLTGGTSVPGLILVGDKKYQKFCTTNGFFYLEEVTQVSEDS